MEQYLTETPMLDFSSPGIQQLIRDRQWSDAEPYDRIRQIYLYVRDDILFGYNSDVSLPASKILVDGYGQCNTKGTLFMALLRGVNIPCRVHGFTIDKKLQKGAMTGLVYRSAPKTSFTAGSKFFWTMYGMNWKESYWTRRTSHDYKAETPPVRELFADLALR